MFMSTEENYAGMNLQHYAALQLFYYYYYYNFSTAHYSTEPQLRNCNGGLILR